MAKTSNFDRDNFGRRQGNKLILRIPPGHTIGTDSPAVKPGKSCSYLWILGPRRRAGKSWRDVSPVN
jgi:hypothetical protein